MNETRILTKHPKGLKGVNILQRRYELIKEFILEKIVHHKKITYQKLSALAIYELRGSFDGKVGWYIVVVKLDLEARNIIERIPETSPHQLCMKESN